MEKRPDPTPEGILLGEALKRSGLSARAAAKRAGMSDNRWHQIVKGYQPVGRGVFAPVRDAPADTVARMALVVGVTPEQLAEAGRDDAAEQLRKMPAPTAAGEPDEPTVAELAAQVAELTAKVEAVLRRLNDQGKAS
jgi:plasmid maintenance system antidote protein VapI